MIDNNTLRRQARDDCLEHAERVLTGELFVELLEGTREWDPIELRHVFDQPMVIWRRFNEFEVIVDQNNRPVGFIDFGGWENCVWQELDIDTAVALVRETGWLSSGVEATGSVARGAAGAARLTLRDPLRDEGSQHFVVTINPASRKVISLVPREMESEDHEV